MKTIHTNPDIDDAEAIFTSNRRAQYLPRLPNGGGDAAAVGPMPGRRRAAMPEYRIASGARAAQLQGFCFVLGHLRKAGEPAGSDPPRRSVNEPCPYPCRLLLTGFPRTGIPSSRTALETSPRRGEDRRRLDLLKNPAAGNQIFFTRVAPESSSGSPTASRRRAAVGHRIGCRRIAAARARRGD